MCQKTNLELFLHTECINSSSDSSGNTIRTASQHENNNNNKNVTPTLLNGNNLDFEKTFNDKYAEKLLQYGDKVEKMHARSEGKTHPHQNISTKIHRDFIAIGTQYTRLFFKTISDGQKAVMNTTAFKILTRTTQPAHVIAISIVLLVLGVVWPNFFADKSDATSEQSNRSVWTILAYLTTFAVHFGAQVWMTFVSGLALYFSLPRHTFGLCQQVLFPKYFALNSVLSILTLITFVKVHGSNWELSSYIQVIALTVCALIELTVRLYLAKPLLKLMRAKYEFESRVGSGSEVGHLAEGDLVHCPHYQKIHKAFRKIHMMCAMGNMFAMVCTCVHLHYLASKIQIR